MVNKELIDYIEQCRKLGQSDSQIRNSLLKEGWTEADILEAMFKYTKPKNPRNKIFIFGFILAGLLVILTIGGAIFMLNDIQNTSAEIANLTRDIHTKQEKDVNETYRNETLGFEVKYPTDVFTLDAANATLTHTLKTFHKFSLKDGSDLGLAQDIKIVFKKDISECDNADSVLAGSGTVFQAGELSGLKYEMGAEGEGIVLYCARDSQGKNIFVVERYFLSEAWSTDLPNQADFIPSAQQEQIVNQVLNSFRFNK